MQMNIGGCCCSPPFECIPDCPKSGNFTYDNIKLNMEAPTYSLFTDSDSFRYKVGDAVANVYNPDVEEIGPSKDLRKRPNTSAFGYGQRVGSSGCLWLWNNPIAVPSKWLYQNFLNCNSPFFPLPYTPSSITDGTSYVPVNAVDSTDPWDRVLIANADTDCDDCFCAGCGTMSLNPRGHYRCGNIIYYTAGSLYIIESGAPAGSPPYYTAGGSGYLYWVFEFKVMSNWSWSFNTDTQFTRTAMSGAGTFGIDLTNQPNFGGQSVGGVALDGAHPSIAIVQYAKAIDCDTDFEGDPVVIPFNSYVDKFSDITITLDTYPTEVSIELYT